MASKQIDRYLKSIIEAVPKELDEFVNSGEKKIKYYSGNWSEDCAANLTEKQMERMFKKMIKMRDKVIFTQKRIPTIKDAEGEDITGFEYFALKRA